MNCALWGGRTRAIGLLGCLVGAFGCTQNPKLWTGALATTEPEVGLAMGLLSSGNGPQSLPSWDAQATDVRAASLDRLTPFWSTEPTFTGHEVHPEALAFVLCQPDSPFVRYVVEVLDGQALFAQNLEDAAWLPGLASDGDPETIACAAARSLAQRITAAYANPRLATLVGEAEATGATYSVFMTVNCCFESGTDVRWRERIREGRRLAGQTDTSNHVDHASVEILLHQEFGWITMIWTDITGEHVHVWEFRDMPEVFSTSADLSFGELDRRGRALHRFGVPENERIWRLPDAGR